MNNHMKTEERLMDPRRYNPNTVTGEFGFLDYPKSKIAASSPDAQCSTETFIRQTQGALSDLERRLAQMLERISPRLEAQACAPEESPDSYLAHFSNFRVRLDRIESLVTGIEQHI